MADEKKDDVFRDEAAEEAAAIGLSKEELAKVREDMFRQWPERDVERR